MSEKQFELWDFACSRRRLATIVTGLFAIGLISLGRLGRVFEYLSTTSNLSISDEWEDLGLAPGGESKYPPQGMVHTPDGLYFTNHWNNQASGLYRLDPESGAVEEDQVMPEEATHTSGLAWDGEMLWALDHGSNKLYKIDPAKLFEDNQDAFEESFSTGLTAASALTCFTVDGEQYLALSDFVWSIQSVVPLPTGTSNTYIVKLNTVSKLKNNNVDNIATLDYSNGGYSQGLTHDGTFLYESVNSWEVDTIKILNINSAIKNQESVDTIGSFDGPASRIEDLGNDGSNLWTSDEGSYRLYKLDSLSTVREDALLEKSDS